MKTERADLRAGFEARLAGLGFDLVQMDLAGHAGRPVVRLRVERDPPDRAVSLDDCARISRHMEGWLDGEGEFPDSYVLEVSSPGIERPLVRDRDFERFQGSRVAVSAPRAVPGRPDRMEGELLGLASDPGGSAVVRIRLNGGDEVDIPRTGIASARLVHEWGAR